MLPSVILHSEIVINSYSHLNWIVTQRITILSSFTDVVLNPYDLLFSVAHKITYFEEGISCFCL